MKVLLYLGVVCSILSACQTYYFATSSGPIPDEQVARTFSFLEDNCFTNAHKKAIISEMGRRNIYYSNTQEADLLVSGVTTEKGKPLGEYYFNSNGKIEKDIHLSRGPSLTLQIVETQGYRTIWRGVFENIASNEVALTAEYPIFSILNVD